MQQYPHVYTVRTAADQEGPVALRGDGLPELLSTPPKPFGGPGDRWSPEDLLVAAVADCLVLTFRAIARASKLPWERLECDCEGVLDRVDNVTRFTRFELAARLVVAPGTDRHKALQVLEKAEAVCLITNSLNAEVHLKPTILSGS